MSDNLIDKPLMSTLQWVWLCAGLVAGTNTVNLFMSRLEKVEIGQKTQNELHIKDYEILLHKMNAKGGRTDDDLKNLWIEFNKLKENHEESY